ncbi:MAG: SRPBCC family protein [Gammaproteobacteria bacterium]
MKILRKIVLVVLLLPIVLLLVSFFLPSKYRVERDAVLLAPSEVIYPWLAQLRKWPEWTVWNSNYDATLAYTYSGPAEGAGAEMSLTSKSGNGSLKLTAADVKTGVKYELNFEEGKFVCGGAVAMAPAEGGTRVTFSNEGEFGKNPVRRYFGLFIDKKMGGMFEKNLQGLRQKSESKAN